MGIHGAANPTPGPSTEKQSPYSHRCFGCISIFMHGKTRRQSLGYEEQPTRKDNKARKTGGAPDGRTMRARFKRWREECPRPR